MLYLTKGSFWLFIGRGFNLMAGLAVTVAFANLLTKENFGTYQFILSMAAIIGSCTLSNMSTAITREVANGSEGALRYGFRVQLQWSAAMALVSLSVALYYILIDNTTLAIGFLIVGTFSPFMVGFGLGHSYLIGKQLFKESVLFGMWRKPIPLIALLGSLAFTRDPIILVFVYFASSTLSSYLLYLYIVKKFRLPTENNEDMVNYSKHLSFIALISVIGSNLDKILIFHFIGPAAAATYALALLPVKHMQSAFGLLRKMAFPKFSKRNYSELQETLPRKVRLGILTSAMLVAIYILTAPYVFKLLFPTYPEAILISQVLALLVLSVPRGFYTLAFTAHQMKRELYLSRLTLPALTIFFLLILLPPYGIWGVVAALFISHLVVNILIRYLFNRRVTTQTFKQPNGY